MEVELVILTKSSKNKGYCVAGIDIKSGQWIRLTSDNESSHGALFTNNMQYEDKTICQILDVVRVKIVKRNPVEYQPENILIDKSYYWQKTGRYTIQDVLRIEPFRIKRTRFRDCFRLFS
jgi:hypothetical protein